MKPNPEDITVLVGIRSIAKVHDVATGMHAHHAFKVMVSGTGTITVRLDDGQIMRRQKVVVVRPHQPHAVQVEGGALALFFEPETRLQPTDAEHPRNRLSSREQTRLARLDQRFGDVLDHADVGEGVMTEVLSLVARPPRGPFSSSRALFRPQPNWDPRVHEVVEMVRAAQNTPSLAQLADSVRLSRYRLSHLFREEVGASLRQFSIWAKMQRAVIHYVEHGGTFTDAALAGGFSDQAHFTRTFGRMFGLPPSILPARSKKVQSPGSFNR